MTSWQMHKQCDECPWRRDVPVHRFTEKRFRDLRKTVEQGFAPMFACHKTPECNQMACVGYVVNQVFSPLSNGPQNFNLRLAISRQRIDPEKMTIVGPQYLSYDEMEKANRR
jgi:hypothetical protein